MLISLLLSTVAWADCMPLSLDEVSEQARVLMSQGEPKLALAKVDEAIESFPCRTELIRVEDLGELYQVGGTAARQAGDSERAMDLYGRAARMVAPIEFYGTLGDLDRQTYEAQLSAASPPHSSTLVSRGTVFVDGYELRAGVEQGVPSGAHLVQELLPDGSRRSTVVDVPAGGRVEVGSGPAPRPRGRRALGVAGGALVAVGVGALAADVVWASDVSQYDQEEAPIGPMNALLFGGVAATGVGTTLFLSATFSY